MRSVPSGELTFCHGKSPFLMGKSTISMAIFHGKMLVHQRVGGLVIFQGEATGQVRPWPIEPGQDLGVSELLDCHQHDLIMHKHRQTDIYIHTYINICISIHIYICIYI